MVNSYDSIVIGAGHAGVEAGLALARLNKKVLLLTLSLDSISFMACNPNIGGTAKGHLVREIDALGGQMGLSADSALLQLKMLNLSKGAAVQSLRGQADKTLYHLNMKTVVENEHNLTLLQAEVTSILVSNNCAFGVHTSLGEEFYAPTVILCSGVYLDSTVIIGDWRKNEGPSGFSRACGLSKNLEDLGIPIRRFKTGTPARIHKDSVDFTKMSRQDGDPNIYPFSFLNDNVDFTEQPCYLTYTNELTHQIIRDNIFRSPLYNGSIKSVGPRYCPSIEDKVMRFADKNRHQIFIEPESAFTKEMYVQGMSSSLPYDVQLQMYRSIAGLEDCKILRYAYAIEYDCIDSTNLTPALMIKHINGLFMAGQINGSSGYEEAAAQGLIAGINANQLLDNKPPLILGRNEAYIGVLIDDLVTLGTNEPYRMMTARAEFRLNLRQENADIRLTEYGRQLGLVKDDRYNKFLLKRDKICSYQEFIKKSVSPKLYSPLFESVGEQIAAGGLSYKDMLKRSNITPDLLLSYFQELSLFDARAFAEVATMVKYEGYLQKQESSILEVKKLENKSLPVELDYLSIEGLSLEARQKLNKIKPINLGQASRISGVSPADITFLMVYLFKK